MVAKQEYELHLIAISVVPSHKKPLGSCSIGGNKNLKVI